MSLQSSGNVRPAPGLGGYGGTPKSGEATGAILTRAGRRNFRNSMTRDSHWVARSDLQSLQQLITDFVVLITASVIAATLIRISQGMSQQAFLIGLATDAVVALVFILIARLVYSGHPASLTTRFDRLLDGAVHYTMAFAIVVFLEVVLNQQAAITRSVIITSFLSGVTTIAAWRALAAPWVHEMVNSFTYSRKTNIIIADAASNASDELSAILVAAGYPQPIVMPFRGSLGAHEWAVEHEELLRGVKLTATRVPKADIYICAAGLEDARLNMIERGLNMLPRNVFIVPDDVVGSLVRCRFSVVGNRIAIEVRSEPMAPFESTLKRLIDMAMSAAALFVFAPLFLSIAFLIKLDSRGPVLFCQKRNGYGGKPFRIFKFRSMTVMEDGATVTQAERNDRRVTRIGRILRKTSLDELPQLFNVLLGDMSLVGPRPHAIAHDEMYAKVIDNYHVRQQVKPGITGWAQVNGLRGETATLDAMYRRIECDLWYAAHSSVLLDIEILFRTVFEVLRQRNAY